MKSFTQKFQSSPSRLTFNRQGSATLIALFTTLSGVLFALLFTNFVRFVSAVGAVQEAARVTARCITPTDPECVSISAAAPLEADKRWFGFSTNEDNNALVFAREATYSGEIPQREFSASFASTELQSGQREVTWETWEVPFERYYILLNSFANLYTDLNGTYRSPNGSQTVTCSAKDAGYVPNNLNEDHLKGIGVNPLRDNRWCETSRAHTALIQACRAQTGVDISAWTLTECDVQLPPSDGTGMNRWLLLGGDPVCEGENGAPAEKELQSTSYNAVPGMPGMMGRPTYITNQRQFLVVDVPLCNREAFFSELKNTVNSTESLIQHFEKATTLKGPGFPEVQFTQDGSSYIHNQSPTTLGNGLLSEYSWTYLRWKRGEEVLTRKVCNILPQKQAEAVWPEVSELRAGSWSSGSEYVSADRDSSGVLWKKVSGLRSPCALAERVTEPANSFTCSNQVLQGASFDLSQCSGWSEKRNAIEKEFSESNTLITNTLNNYSEFKSLPSTSFIKPPKANAALSGHASNLTWVKSWTDTYSNGSLVPAQFTKKSNVEINEKLVQFYSDSTAYKAPTPANWRTIVGKQLALGATDNGYDAFLTQAQRLLNVRESQKPIPLSNFNPFVFEGTSYELYWGDSSAQYDFDLNCSDEPKCMAKEAKTFASKDQALRFYAHKKYRIDEILNPDVVVNFTEEKSDSLSMLANVKQSELSSLGVPACLPTQTSCLGNAAVNRVDLGLAHDAPSQCMTGSLTHCYFELENIANTQEYAPLQIDEATARSKGLSEIARVFPEAKNVSCEAQTTPGCTEINIKTVEGFIEIDVRYQMPISFPLSSILGAEAVTIQHSVKEPLEIELAVRQ
jgi:hypothetical protein